MNFNQQIILYVTVIIGLSYAIFYKLNPIQKNINIPYIVCTTTIIADALQNIVQDKIAIVTLMGPGIDPHLYKPVESDILKIACADIIFYNGLHLEAQLGHLLKQLARTQTTVAITKDIPKSQLLSVSHFDTIFDPHIWFDINLWIIAINTMSKTVIKKYPEHKNFFKKNTKKYISKLKNLLKQTHAMMANIPQDKKIIVTGHDAFSYFAREYNCSVIGLQGISTESTPGAYNLQKIINIICERNIPAIFIESSLPIKNILAIQEGVVAQNKTVKLGGEIYSDALGPKNSCGDTYVNMMLYNVKTIMNALL